MTRKEFGKRGNYRKCNWSSKMGFQYSCNTPKRNGQVRLCFHARQINTAIERETYPIPTLDSIIDDMNGCKIFSKIDMKEAYTQIELSPESREITNFHTESGIKRFTRLCYGINKHSRFFNKPFSRVWESYPMSSLFQMT